MSRVKVAKVSDLLEGEGKCVKVAGRRIALFKFQGKVYALDDTCPHEGGPLSEGVVENGEVECPWHSASFNLDTGELTCPPADEDVTAYHVRVDGDDVELEL